MTTIFLVRHGETNWNAEGRMQGQTDIPLNTKGIEQAEACGAALNPNDYDRLISSHLNRARKTAEIINAYLNLPFEQMEDFAERHFGDGEGLTIEERKTLYPDHNYPNQEEREAFSQRVMNGLTKVATNHPNKKVLVVAHGAVINQILAVLSNGEIGSGKTRVENTSISTIRMIDGLWHIVDYNQVTHLLPLNQKTNA